MSGKIYTIPTKFTAIDGVSPVVRGMERNVYSYAEKANASIARQERLFRKLTPGLGNATKQLLSYASAGALIGGIGYSGKAILDYETAIQSLSAVTGVSGAQLESFKKEIEDLANKSKKSATDVAGSFETIGSMMSQYLDDPKALRQISEAGITLAKASRQELVPTLENMTSIMNQFNLVAGQSNEVINRLTAGEIVGSLRTAQVAQSLQQFGANAATANVSLSESVALVEALAKQRPAENLGIDARNLLIVMDSAKALDKKAKMSMRKSGIDMGFLMDKTHSLSERFHELSKLKDNAVGMIRVFGERNVTAAKVIFNQLPTYDAYLAKIQTTNQAQAQAATNSNTLAQAADRLTKTWINYITTGDAAASGTERLKNALGYITENMDSIVNVGMNVLKFYATWKAAIIAAKIYTVGLNIQMGIQNVLQLQSASLIEGNAVAKAAATVTETLWAASIAVSTGNMAALNKVMAANPIGLFITGAVALAGTLYLLSKREKELTDQYKTKAKLETVTAINNETDAVKKLVAQYVLLGEQIDKAASRAIKNRLGNIGYRRKKTEERINKTKEDLETEKGKLYLGDLFTGAFGEGHAMYGKREQLAQQLAAQQQEAKLLASQNVSEREFAQQQYQAGNLNKKDAVSILDSPPGTDPGKMDTSKAPDWLKNQKQDSNEFYQSDSKGNLDLLKMFEKLINNKRSDKIMIEFKNAPAGTTVTSSTISNPAVF